MHSVSLSDRTLYQPDFTWYNNGKVAIELDDDFDLCLAHACGLHTSKVASNVVKQTIDGVSNPLCGPLKSQEYLIVIRTDNGQ